MWRRQVSTFFLAMSFQNRLLMMNQRIGTSSAGSKLSVLQSFSWSSESPDPVMSSPPTMSSSAMSASLTAVLEIIATR